MSIDPESLFNFDEVPLEELPSAFRFKLGLATLMRSLILPTLASRGRTARDVDALMRMRHFRYPGELGRAKQTRFYIPLDRRLQAQNMDAALPLVCGPGTLVHRYGLLSFRELARREGLEALPPDPKGRTSLGMGAPLFGSFFSREGFEPGARYRQHMLMALTRAGVLEEARDRQWFTYIPGTPPLTDQEDQLRSRLLTLSTLTPTVLQRFMRGPGHLRFMGFIGTGADRRALGERMSRRLWAWVERKRVPMWEVLPNQEAELVSVVLCVAVGVRYNEGPRLAHPEPAEELFQTVLSDVMMRMGEGDDARLFFQTMLLERVFEDGRLEQVPEDKLLHYAAELLAVHRETLRKWQKQPSLEGGDVRRPFERDVYPALLLKVISLAQERWPDALSVMDIKDVARVQCWPKAQQEADAITLVCQRLTGLHLLTCRSYKPQPDRQYLPVYQALGPKGTGHTLFEQLPKDFQPRLQRHLRLAFDLFRYLPGEEVPRFYAQHALIRRADLPELDALSRELMRSELRADCASYSDSNPETEPIPLPYNSISFSTCLVQPIGLKKLNGEYT